MFINGPEYLGLELVLTMVAAYVVVLAIALATAAVRRLVHTNARQNGRVAEAGPVAG